MVPEVVIMYRTMMIKKESLHTLRMIFVSGFLMLLANQAFAGVFEGNQLFVSLTGDDSVTRANNDINNPWKSIEKAMLTAEPGDVVNFRAGTYTAPNIVTNGSVTSAKNGTETSRIVFTNYQDEAVTFNGGRIRIDRQYWTVSGINGETADVLFWIGQDGDGTSPTGANFILEKGTFTLTQQGGDVNKAPIVLQTGGAVNAIVRDNRFIGPGKGLNMNTAGVFVFRSQGIKVMNNEFSGFPTGMFYKHPGIAAPTGIEIAYNYFHDNGTGLTSSSIYGNIHDNLFVNNSLFMGEGSGAGDDGSNAGADYNTVSHNTFVGEKAELIGLGQSEGWGATNNILRDNIFTRTLYLIPWKNIDHKTTLDYNLYPAGNAVLNNNSFYSLSQWQSTYGQDANSITGSPVFVGGATPSYISGYALTLDSPGYKKASDGRDIGANIALVGIFGQDGVARPKPPLVSP